MGTTKYKVFLAKAVCDLGDDCYDPSKVFLSNKEAQLEEIGVLHEVTGQELNTLQIYIHKLNRDIDSFGQKYILYIFREPADIKLDVKAILQKEKKKEAKKEAARQKRVEAAKKRIEEREKKKLEELKAKYDG